MDIKLRNIDGHPAAEAALRVAFWFAHDAEKTGIGESNGAAVVEDGQCFFAYRTKAGTIVVVQT